MEKTKKYFCIMILLYPVILLGMKPEMSDNEVKAKIDFLVSEKMQPIRNKLKDQDSENIIEYLEKGYKEYFYSQNIYQHPLVPTYERLDTSIEEEVLNCSDDISELVPSTPQFKPKFRSRLSKNYFCKKCQRAFINHHQGPHKRWHKKKGRKKEEKSCNVCRITCRSLNQYKVHLSRDVHLRNVADSEKNI